RQDVNPGWRYVAVEVVSRTFHSRSAKRAHQSAEHRTSESTKRVNGGNRDHAGANESNLCSPDRDRVRVESLSDGRWLHCSKDRHCNYPRNDLTDEHRHTNRKSNEVSRTEQRERPAEIPSRRSRAYSRKSIQLGGCDPCRGDDRESSRCDRAQYDCDQSFARFT